MYRSAWAFVNPTMCTEYLPHLLVTAFANQVQIHITERRQESVRIIARDDSTVVLCIDPVIGDLIRREIDLPDSAMLVDHRSAYTIGNQPDRFSARAQYANTDLGIVLMGPEDRVRIMVPTIDNAIEFGSVPGHGVLEGMCTMCATCCHGRSST